MHQPEKVQSYLKKHSFNNLKLKWNSINGIENVIVIPAISEYENLPALLTSLAENDKYFLRKTLILFVVNNTIFSSPEIKENNQKSLSFLSNLISKNHFRLSDNAPTRLQIYIYPPDNRNTAPQWEYYYPYRLCFPYKGLRNFWEV